MDRTLWTEQGGAGLGGLRGLGDRGEWGTVPGVWDRGVGSGGTVMTNFCKEFIARGDFVLGGFWLGGILTRGILSRGILARGILS